jgi:hypothetical protein
VGIAESLPRDRAPQHERRFADLDEKICSATGKPAGDVPDPG